ncbi:single-stranded-DNA-specific exonuclease RecJ [Paenibacillus sp. KR2-11]|uniref:single-stranded-DNA-specific exonuclease RecJ n=1 Tax=Paenibacillus sp. KR2-11 TaxID=3385500 RepID=UPI0038FC2E10
MLQAKARWNIGEADEPAVKTLSQQLGLSPLLSRLLVVRGMTDTTHAAEFLDGGTDHIHDPYLLDGMERAVRRIRQALESGERIRIYGDYDADGVSSTTLMVYLLRQLDCTFDYYIPHRVTEGYGLNTGAMNEAHKQGIGLIITVDTGISAVEEIAHAASLGIDVIVTDHHEPPEVLPEAFALINPKKPGCPYPYKHLAGVGVALKLAQALLGRWPEELLPYAAIGTVADLMPLTEENRMIVKMGLQQMRTTSNSGIKALLAVAGIPLREVTSTHIGFALGPRINASGRLLSADTAVKLLTTEDDREAERLAGELDLLNKERQRIVDEMAKEAFAQVERQRQESGILPRAIVLAQEDWNVGVIGIVASKIVDRYYRPTVILGIDRESGMAKGSARSIAGFDMHKALTHCEDLMDHYGGHYMAAGMTLDSGQLGEFARRLDQLAGEWLQPQDFLPLLQADAECDFSEITLESILDLEKLGPFGTGNPSPRFVFRGVKLSDLRTMGKEQQHLKLSLKGAGETASALEAVAFNKGTLSDWITPNARIDLLGELSVNEWNGVRRPQILMQDLQVTDPQLFDWRGTPKPGRKVADLCERLQRRPQGHDHLPPAVVVFRSWISAELREAAQGCALWYCDLEGHLHPAGGLAGSLPLHEARDIVLYHLPERLEQLHAVAVQAGAAERYYAAWGGAEDKNASQLPDRSQFKLVYGALAGSGEGSGTIPSLTARTRLAPEIVRFILDVFTELGFVEVQGENCRLLPVREKKDLTASLLYRSRMDRSEVEERLLYTTARELLGILSSTAHHTTIMMEGIL